MASLQKQLAAFGFIKLPEFNPEYFRLRAKIGFLLLLNQRHKLSYHVFTINAHSCLYSANKVIEGENADRARDLRQALRESTQDDWVVYFRPNGLYPGLRNQVKELVKDYQSLNTFKPRINQEEITWAYQVHHETFNRTFTVISNEPIDDEKAIAKFLHKWRKSLNDLIKRKTIDLPTYYAASKQLSDATNQWMKDETKSFSIIELEQLSGKTRREVVKHTGLDNSRRTKVYKQTLAA